jgi:hypothetical protein
MSSNCKAKKKETRFPKRTEFTKNIFAMRPGTKDA